MQDKLNVLATVRDHPKWNLKTLQNHGCSKLVRMDELTKWKKHVIAGGTRYDKLHAVNEFVYQQFLETRAENRPVNTRTLQEWALQKSQHFPNFEFSASQSWVEKFKNKHRIRQRAVTRYIKPSEHKSVIDVKQKAEQFQKECFKDISNFDLRFVLNTDQMGCEYRSNIKRTLDHRGTKSVELYIGDLNKVTHSYTVMYTISASGTLLPKVFICLQEPGGQFGPRVAVDVQRYEDDFGNVYVTCSGSGKMSTALMKTYLDEIIKPYVGSRNFLFLLDTWSGQSNQNLLEDFVDEQGNPSCTAKWIPPSTTRFCQPLDVYFHRQLKIFIKLLQNSTYLLQNKREINTRVDCIKIQALLHNQISAPIFKFMIQYAWYASKMINDRDIFWNVKDVCFPERPPKSKCSDCDSTSFARCSWCRHFVCFVCYYDKYHPKSCEMFFRNV